MDYYLQSSRIDWTQSSIKKRDPGKKGAAVELKKTRILALIHGRPQSFAINRASWNLPSLTAAYSSCYGEPISESTVGRLIRKAGYKVKKARRVLSSPDPEY